MLPLAVHPKRRRYRALIATGGIGSGVFFALNGNHTLGREESRSGRFLDRRDYCKLHIIAHYVQALLGPEFHVLPIGRVGDDAAGRGLLAEMAEAGLDLRYGRAMPGEQTMYAICFVYPDGTGGNLTVDDSACSRVTPALMREAEADLAAYGREGIVLAAPEVPLAARAELMALGTRYGALRAASFTREEMATARDAGMLAGVDLLAANREEAAALAGVAADAPAEAVARKAVEALQHIQPGAWLSVTAGRDGSWVWDGQALIHQPAQRVEVVSTAGAGDAHLAGLLVGLAAGLALMEAQELATLMAALSVTSPHTIDKGIDRASLRTLAAGLPARPCAAVRELLELA